MWADLGPGMGADAPPEPWVARPGSQPFRSLDDSVTLDSPLRISMRGGRVIIRNGGAMACGVRGNESMGLQAAMEAQLTQSELRIEFRGFPP
jgi:hypothetical protein